MDKCDDKKNYNAIAHSDSEYVVHKHICMARKGQFPESRGQVDNRREGKDESVKTTEPHTRPEGKDGRSISNTGQVVHVPQDQCILLRTR